MCAALMKDTKRMLIFALVSLCALTVVSSQGIPTSDDFNLFQIFITGTPTGGINNNGRKPTGGIRPIVNSGRKPTSGISSIINNGRSCTIRNMKFNEYFYAADNSLKYDSERGRLFTYKKQYDATHDPQSQWNFESRDNGRYFDIKNNYFNQYLYAATNEYSADTQRRNIFIWLKNESAGEQGKWFLESQGGDIFKIKNSKFNEYLYAAEYSYDDTRRYVYTWYKFDDCETESCYWEIKC